MKRARPRWATPFAQLLTAAGASAALAEPVRCALLKQGTLDVPNHRSSHKTPVPRGGGIAAVLGAVAASLLSSANPGARTTTGILGIAGLGFADDRSGHLSAKVRLAGQLTVGSATFANSLGEALVAGPVTAGVVNVVNFMDGINGITGMTAVVWGINAMLMDDGGDPRLSTLGALTAGAGLGFLPHNIPEARLFLGDVGSYAFGAAMAAGILSQSTAQRRYRVGAPLVLYAADAAQAILRRAKDGKPLHEAHREHVYQRMVDGGRSHVEVACMHAAASTVIAMCSRASLPVAVLGTAAVVAVYLVAAPTMDHT